MTTYQSVVPGPVQVVFNSIGRELLYIVGCGALFLLMLYIYLYPMQEALCSVRNIKGPEPTSFLWGNLKEIWGQAPGQAQLRWFAKYGNVVRYRFAFGEQQITINDLTAVAYVYQHTDEFGKPYRSIRTLEDLLGRGLLTLDPHDHRRQRRVLNPAFSLSSVRSMIPDFLEEANKLKDRMLELAHQAKGAGEKQAGEIDVHDPISHTTLDIIGVSGFGMQDISSDDSPLGEEYSGLLGNRDQSNFLDFLQMSYPLFKDIPIAAVRRQKKARKVIDAIGHEIVAERKKAVMAGAEGDDKDMLSRLIRANLAPDLKPEQRMTDDEVMGQITTFMFAGHETTSTSMSWTLWRLAQNQDIQDELRAELNALETETPSLDELNTCALLENVVRESIRLDGAVAISHRVALRDTVLPLSAPVIGRDGKAIDALRIKKGTSVNTPVISINRSADIWGPDADQFVPKRYTRNDGFPTKVVPGMYGNVLTFLAGPHNCIGYRFAMAEMKALLFTLVRAIKFEIPKAEYAVQQHNLVTMRPKIHGEIQMRLVLSPVQ